MASIVAGHTTYELETDAEDHVIDAPTHSEGDLIFIVCAADRPNASYSSTGFSLLGGSDLDTSSLTGAILYKTAGGAEPGTYTVTAADVTADRIAAIAFAVTDHDGLDATLVTTDGDSTTATCPAITPGVDDALCIRAVMADRDPDPVGSMTDYTDLDEAVTPSSGGTVKVFYRTLSGTGEEAAGTASLSEAEQWIGASWTVAPASGTDYVRVIDESEAATEGSQRSIALARLIAETVATSEAVARLIAFVRLVAETVAVSETAARPRTLARLIADTVALSEATARIRALIRTLSDTAAISEASARARTLVRSIADTLATSEASQATRGLLRTVADTAAITEAVSRARGTVRIVADTVATSEAVAQVQGLVRIAAEALGLTETSARRATLLRIVADTVAVTEAIVRSLSQALIRVVNESVSIVDALLTLRGISILKSTLNFVTRRKSVDIE